MRKPICGLLVAMFPATFAYAGFQSLGLPGSQLIALSHDGCVAAGSLIGGEAGGFRWSAARGVELLREAITVRGLSASGRYVSGSLLDEQARQVAGYWDAEGRPQRLGGLVGSTSVGQISEAFGISDEPRIVGSARRSTQGQAAFVWTREDGMRELPSPRSGASTRALGLGAGGRIYGWMHAARGAGGVLWHDGRVQTLFASNGDAAGELLGANHRGDVLLGVSDRRHGEHAVYRWSAADGVRALPLGATPAPLYLFASSDDGRILVGGSGAGDRREAVLWIEGRSIVTLAQLLAEHTIRLPSSWRPSVLTAVSGDGRRLAGWGTIDGRLDSFIVDLEPPAATMSCSARGR